MSGIIRKIANGVTDALDSVTLKHFKPFTSAVITVGGSGTRMKSETGLTKQFMELHGLPVVTRTVLEFQASPYIDEIIIVSKAEEISLYTEMIDRYELTKVTRVVKGGASRSDSVLNGFKAISKYAEYVAIHDGVRCLITAEDIKKVIKSAYANGCAAAASRIYDTLKIADSDMFIKNTVDRSTAWCAQTPQVFRTDVYRACAFSAKKEGLTVTDDCMLAEKYGFKIKLVDCGRNNLKITTKDDLIIAEAILASRSETKNGDNK